MGNDNYEERRRDYQHFRSEPITENEAAEFLRQGETSRMMSMLLDFGTSRETGYLAPPHIFS